MRERGDLRPETDLDELSMALLTALQGGSLRSHTLRNSAPMRASMSAPLAYVNSSMVTSMPVAAARCTRPTPWPIDYADAALQVGALDEVERAVMFLRRQGASGRPDARHRTDQNERRVAELVAAGRSNQEVAAALFMSVKTVEAHLTRIYRKLSLRSRTELARRLANGTP